MNIKMINHSILSLLFLFAITTDGYSQLFGKKKKEKWISEITYDSGKLGSALQSPFFGICDACGITRKEINPKKNYIPKDILSFISNDRLSKTSVKTGEANGVSLFKAVFNSSQVDQSTSISSLTPSDFLPVSSFSQTSTPYSVLVQDFSWFQYHRTCAGILNATINASTSATIPAANVKASLSKEMEKKTSIVVYGGWFSSPYLRMLDDPKTSVKFYSGLWDYYRTHPTINGKLYLMKNFQGILIGTTKESSDFSKFEQKSEINLATPFAAGQVQSQSKFDISSGFKSVQWTPIIYDNFSVDERSRLFEELATAERTAAFLTEISKNPTITSADGKNFAIGQEHSHFFLIEGFPVSLAGQQLWVIEQSNFPAVYKGGQVSFLVRPIYDNAGSHNGNEFTIKGVPRDDLFPADPARTIGSVTLTYTLKTRTPIHGEHIRVIVNSGIQTSSHPIPEIPEQISYELKNIRQQTGSKLLADIEWSKQISMTDAQNLVSNLAGSRGEISKAPTLKFNDGLTKPVECSLVMKDGRFVLTITQKNAEFQNGIDFSPNLAKLEGDFDASIRIPLRNGQTSEKIFRTKLTYPIEKKIIEVSPVALIRTTGSEN